MLETFFLNKSGGDWIELGEVSCKYFCIYTILELIFYNL